MKCQCLAILVISGLVLAPYNISEDSNETVADSNSTPQDLNVNNGDSNSNVNDININAQDDNSAIGGRNSIIDDLNSLNPDQNNLIDVNVIADSNNKIDSNQVIPDRNSGLYASEFPPDLNNLSDANISDSNNLVDQNDLVQIPDLNESIDQNLDSENEVFTIPDFNFYRLLEQGPSVYLVTFDPLFVSNIALFVNNIFTSASNQGQEVIPVPGFNPLTLYLVPDANFFLEIKTPNAPGFELLKTIKSVLDAMQPAGQKEELPISQDIVVNGEIAKCFGVSCDKVPEEVE